MVLILFCAAPGDIAPTAKKSLTCPIIVINGYVNAAGVYNISCDEKNAIYNLVMDLYKKGCRSIYFLEDNITYSARQKREGFLKAIHDCNLAEKSSCIQVPLDTHELMSAKQQIERLMEKGYDIDAVLSADDILAVGALQALNNAGLSVPVIGFNNSDYAICCTPYLTSIDNRIEFMCNTAIDTLMALLNGDEALERIVLSAKLVERETYVSKD